MSVSDTPPTNADLLERLNAIRADLGHKQLKAWKGSRAELESTLQKAKIEAQQHFDKKIAAAEATADANKIEVKLLGEEGRGETRPVTAEDMKDAVVIDSLTELHPGDLNAHPVVKARKAEEAKKPAKKTKAKKIAEAQDKMARSDPKVKAKMEERHSKKKAKPTGDTFTLADLARDLDINPKVARAKTRRHATKLEAFRVGTEGWVFDGKHRAEVSKLLKGS